MNINMIVASAKSKWGGPCEMCEQPIKRGEQTYKLNTSRRKSKKNGPGVWVCALCVEEMVSDGRVPEPKHPSIVPIQEALF